MPYVYLCLCPIIVDGLENFLYFTFNVFLTVSNHFTSTKASTSAPDITTKENRTTEVSTATLWRVQTTITTASTNTQTLPVNPTVETKAKTTQYIPASTTVDTSRIETSGTVHVTQTTLFISTSTASKKSSDVTPTDEAIPGKLLRHMLSLYKIKTQTVICGILQEYVKVLTCHIMN